MCGHAGGQNQALVTVQNGMQVAATRQHEAQHPQAGPSSSKLQRVGNGQPPAGQPHAASVKEEEMRSQREDAELQQRAASERRGMPTTVDGFK